MAAVILRAVMGSIRVAVERFMISNVNDVNDVCNKKFAKFANASNVYGMENKTRIVGIRVEAAVFKRLEKMETETGMEKVSLARTALMAVLDHYEATGNLTLPLKVVSSQPRKSSPVHSE